MRAEYSEAWKAGRNGAEPEPGPDVGSREPQAGRARQGAGGVDWRSQSRETLLPIKQVMWAPCGG